MGCIYPEEGYDCDGNAVCNYASVDFVGNESINEYEGVLYFNLESYSQAGISTDGYTANIIVNGDSIPLNHDGCITYDDGNCENNNGWYVGVPVEAGATYSWSVTVETCGGGQTINGEYTSPIPGCTDSLALNYDSTANSNDGSCTYPVYGCTDSLAVNYNALATDEDDSCEYPISGCIDLLSCNYDSLANTDNGSCIYPEEGYDCDGNAVCNYASVDFVGNESINEYEGVLYFNLESYSQAGISTDGYTANIIVNGDSIPLNHDGCITYDDGNCGNNNGCM